MVRENKTIQFYERSLKIPISRCLNSSLCAVYWGERHFAKVPMSRDSPAFQVPCDMYNCMSLSCFLYQRLLKHLGEKVGIHPDSLSSHTWRRYL